MSDYEKRAMIEAEDKYTFQQSTQLSSQTGLIGYLRADMGTDGNGFFSSWNDWNQELKTDAFKQEFDDMINSLREEGDILHSREALAKYCDSNPQSKMTGQRSSYGVRIDTEQYTYLLRLYPYQGDYNLYCYCYVRDWLDRHMEQARHGIRFITPDYEERFRLPDGDMVRIIDEDGYTSDRVARYIDDYHVEIGGYLYHICEVAERMEQTGKQVIPLRSSLPESCYVYVPTEHRIGIVNKGEEGYYGTDIGVLPSREQNEELVDELNAEKNVSKAQAAAMKAGSMFGWHTKAADPANYNADGQMIQKKKDRGDER